MVASVRCMRECGYAGMRVRRLDGCPPARANVIANIRMHACRYLHPCAYVRAYAHASASLRELKRRVFASARVGMFARWYICVLAAT